MTSRHRRFRMCLRTLLMATAVVCLFLGMVSDRAHRQRLALSELERVNAIVEFAPERNTPRLLAGGLGAIWRQDSGRDSDFSVGPSSASYWLCAVFGDKNFRPVVSVGLGGGRITNSVESISETEFSHAHLRCLRNLPDLRVLELDHVGLSDADLQHLRGVRQLERLYLNDNGVTDAGLPHLAELSRLEFLSLRGTKISDSGLPSLRDFKNLRYLDLGNTQITDDGLEQLKTWTHIERIYLDGTRISERERESIRKAPKSNIRLWGPGAVG